MLSSCAKNREETAESVLSAGKSVFPPAGIMPPHLCYRKIIHRKIYQNENPQMFILRATVLHPRLL
jgi:hypothetical protein